MAVNVQNAVVAHQSLLHFAPMTLQELEIVLQWAADEGWNPGVADAAAFFPAGGFYVAKVPNPQQCNDKNNNSNNDNNNDIPIAAISVVPHDTNMAFLGLYICHPDWRGQGIGLAIWEYGLSQWLDTLGQPSCSCIGLDGVPAQVDNYKRSGFQTYGATLRYQGRLTRVAVSSRLVRPMTSADLPTLHQLDTVANGYARPRFLTSWLNGDGQVRDTRVLIDDDESNCLPMIRGFATWRTCRHKDNIKIGPVVAPSTDGAILLIADIVATICPNNNKGLIVIVDVPDQNKSLCTRLEEMGLVVTFSTTRMYRGTPPPTNSTLQAIATMELG